MSLEQRVTGINQTTVHDIGALMQLFINLNGTHITDIAALSKEILAIQQYLNATTEPTPSPSPLPTLAPTPNTPPIVAEQIPTTYARVGDLFKFVIPAGTFTDEDGDSLTLAATLADGGALPSWLSFFPDTQKFLGKPSVENIDELQIQVTASDGHEGQVSDVFYLVVTEEENTPQTLSTSPSYVKDDMIWMGIVGGIIGGCSVGICLCGIVYFLYRKNKHSNPVRQIQDGLPMNEVVRISTSNQTNHPHTSQNMGEIIPLTQIAPVIHHPTEPEKPPVSLSDSDQSDSSEAMYKNQGNHNLAQQSLTSMPLSNTSIL